MPKKSAKHAKSKAWFVTKEEDQAEITCYSCHSPMEEEDSELGPFMRCTNRTCMRKLMTLSQLNFHLCHLCGRTMTFQAKGNFGPFLSCTGFKLEGKDHCLGTVSVKFIETAQLPDKLGPPTHTPTDEQAAIIQAAVTNPTMHIIVDAKAGTGKTSMLRMAAYAMGAVGQKDVRALAFNGKNARDLHAAMPDWIRSTTWHALGKEIIKSFAKNAWHNEYKTKKLMAPHLPMPPFIAGQKWTADQTEMARDHGWQRVLVEKLVSLTKAYLYVTLDDDDPQPTPAQLDEICLNHGINVGKYRDNVYRVTRLVVKEAVLMFTMIDFDDMIAIPALWPTIPDQFKFDTVLCDEVQDLNRAQHVLLQKITRVRIFAVGDLLQSIYAFRGADINSMHNLALMFGVTYQFPLTLTYRCGHAIVEEAQKIAPTYRAAVSNPPGTVQVIDSLRSDLMIPGETMIISRVNASSFKYANLLIQQGVKVVIAGKNIAGDLRNLIQSANERTLEGLLAYLKAEVKKELDAAKKQKNSSSSQIRAVDDASTIFYLSQGCVTIKDLFARIDDLVVDPEKPLPKDVIVLCSAHASKGLESKIVIIADPENFPHPRTAGDARAILQDTHLRYVAQTRAIEKLLYLGSAPVPLEDAEQIGFDILSQINDFE